MNMKPEEIKLQIIKSAVNMALAKDDDEKQFYKLYLDYYVDMILTKNNSQYESISKVS